jgi:hypothetical protein
MPAPSDHDDDPLPLSQIDAGPGASEENRQSETFGMLTVTRHVKDDGRALILYTHRREDETTPDGCT